MTVIRELPITQIIDYKYSRLVEPFYFYSDVLKCWCEIPAGFSCDFESIPLFRGTSKVSGIIHDYYCRIDSTPVVDKKIAADIYKEFLIFRGASWWRWRVKYWTVRMARGYFHKLKVFDTLK